MKKIVLCTLVFILFSVGCLSDEKADTASTSTIATSATSTTFYATTTSTAPMSSTTTTTLAGGYSREPFLACVECPGTYGNLSCCEPSFEEECAAEGGVVRWTDLHPVSSRMLGCFSKASDAGRDCGADAECLAGVCILEDAAASGKCTFVSRGQYPGDNSPAYFVAKYSCLTEKPGLCAEAVRNRMNPGGILHRFEMNGTTLTETQAPGPIH